MHLYEDHLSPTNGSFKLVFLLTFSGFTDDW